MKNLIVFITMIVAGVYTSAQTTNTNTAIKSTETAQNITIEEDKGLSLTSFGNNWVEAGMGFAFQTDTGLIGYTKGNYNVYSKDDFTIDINGGVSYTDMTSQVFELKASVIPAYKFYTYNEVDMTAYANIDLGYGSLWVMDNSYSMVSYAIGCGVEFSYEKVFIKPFFNWVNYELFNNYNTINNYVIGIEAGYQATDNIAVIVEYSHWFAEDAYQISDNEDRLTFGVRYQF